MYIRTISIHTLASSYTHTHIYINIYTLIIIINIIKYNNILLYFFSSKKKKEKEKNVIQKNEKLVKYI
jgi:hypothetical protein